MSSKFYTYYQIYQGKVEIVTVHRDTATAADHFLPDGEIIRLGPNFDGEGMAYMALKRSGKGPLGIMTHAIWVGPLKRADMPPLFQLYLTLQE